MKQTTEAGLSAEFWSLPWCMSSRSWGILVGFELLDVPLRWCQHCQWRPASCSCHFSGTPNLYNSSCLLFGGIVSIEAGNIGQCWDASRTTLSLQLWLYFVWSIWGRSDFSRAFFNERPYFGTFLSNLVLEVTFKQKHSQLYPSFSFQRHKWPQKIMVHKKRNQAQISMTFEVNFLLQAVVTKVPFQM